MSSNLIFKPFQRKPRYFQDGKFRDFLWVCVLLGTLVLLVAGFQNLEIGGGVPLARQDDESVLDLAFFPPSQLFIIVAYALLFVVLLLFFLFKRRKREIGILLLSMLLVVIVSTLPPSSLTKEQSPIQNAASTAVPADVIVPTPLPPAAAPQEFTPPEISNWLLYLVSLLTILSLIFAVWMAYYWRRSRPLASRVTPLAEIGEAARLALDDLEAGLDERDAVVACYARMNEVVMRSQKIERDTSRTATEFAIRLEELGLPGSSVRRLTSLFEAVRYGARESRAVEVEEAKECLSEIAQYCGEAL
ncbi:MAG: DUF4129 domain-containing protein [Anaerolineales bacterium]|nr:MAG: DUF4129 domain-containing protein [Anaerolineales bacterium]